MIETWFTRTLGIEHPICSAGMGRVAEAGLATAVSEAGGCGVLGGVSFDPEGLRREIRAIRNRTDRPFGVNLVAIPAKAVAAVSDARQAYRAMPEDTQSRLRTVWQMFDPQVSAEQVALVLEERPALLVLTFGASGEIIRAAQARGILVATLVGNVSAARKAEAAGVDLLIAQGYEAGGHTGTIATSVLVPSVVDAVRTPVLAAGGIADGRGLAAALALGACGAWVGTRFAASIEAHGHAAYKLRMVEGEAQDTVITRAYSGKTLRALSNAWTAEWETRSADLRPFPEQYTVAGSRTETGFVDGDVAEGMMPAGQDVSLIREVLPAAEIVSSMVRQAEVVLSREVWAR